MLGLGINHETSATTCLTRAPVRHHDEGAFLGLPSIAISLPSATAFRDQPQSSCASSSSRSSWIRCNRHDVEHQRARLAGTDSKDQGGAPRFHQQIEPIMKALSIRSPAELLDRARGSGRDTGPRKRFGRGRKGCISVTPIKIDLAAPAQRSTARRLDRDASDGTEQHLDRLSRDRKNRASG